MLVCEEHRETELQIMCAKCSDKIIRDLKNKLIMAEAVIKFYACPDSDEKGNIIFKEGAVAREYFKE